jgi:PAS domain S-box-containing protein
MKDIDKTKAQLIEELVRLRQRVTQLETVEAERVRAERMSQQYRDHLEELVEKRTAALTKANRQLRHSEERLILAITGTGGAFWDEKLDPEASFDDQPGTTYYSPQEYQLLGYGSENELASYYETWHNHILPEDQALVEQRQRDHFEGRTAYLDHEYRVRLKDGSIRWIRGHSRILRDEQGRPIRWIGIDWDVTERKQAEEELRKYRKHLEELVEERTAELHRVNRELEQEIIERKQAEKGQHRALVAKEEVLAEALQATHALQEKVDEQNLLLDTMDAQVWYLTNVETYGIANRAHAEFLGLRREDIEHKRLEEFLPEETAQVCKESNLQVFQTRGTIHTEEWVMNAEGEERLLAIIKTPKLDQDGNVAYVVCVGTDVTERKRAEKELQESQKFLQDIFDGIRDGISVLDQNLTITQVNKWMEETHHKDMPLIGKKCYAVYQQRENACPWCPSIKALSTGEVHMEEVRVPYNAGSFWWCELSAYPLKDEKGDVVGVIEHVKDITERKQSEEALRESERQYRHLFNSIADSIFVHDLTGRILDVNHKACIKYGYNKEELCQMNAADIDVPDHAICIERRIRRLLENGEITFETVHLDREGNHIPIEVTAKLENYKGQEAVISICHDITERKQAEGERERLTARVREQARKLEQILATVPAGVLLLDAEGRILQVNAAAEKDLVALTDARVGDKLTHLGDRPLAELLASPPTRGLWHEVRAVFTAEATDVSQIADPLHIAATSEAIDGRIANLTSRTHATKTKASLDRRIFEVIARSMMPITRPTAGDRRPVGEGSEQEHWVLVINDVTREREIRAQLQQQQRLAAVGQLAAGIAHDFNNIMASVVLYAQMVARSQTLSTRDRERMTIITQQAWQASRMIEQILDFSRRAVLERRPLDLLALLKEQVKLLERTLPEDIKIELVYETDEADRDSPYMVEADPTRMQQVVTNLAVNARDAMPDGGILHIGLARVTVKSDDPLPELKTGEWIRVTVSDTGTGIAPDVLPHIFEPFFTTKRPGGGSGLGLAQAHGIVGQHGGQIYVETQVDKGTTFTIYLPPFEGRPSESPTSDASTVPQGRGELVLVVEDGDAVRAALVDSLEEWNYRTLEVASGREALIVMKTQGEEVALVLSDVVMPGMGGIALLHALRKQGWQTPVILLTDHAMDGELDKLRVQSVSAWLTKPPSLTQLAQAVADVLRA